MRLVLLECGCLIFLRRYSVLGLMLKSRKESEVFGSSYRFFLFAQLPVLPGILGGGVRSDSDFQLSATQSPF
jgi:hypothetical protein